jgi:ligand-binding sensor domain-containing protein
MGLRARRHSTADGLASNRISQIVTGAQGFLWFATAKGLSRFDGYTSPKKTPTPGLPHRAVNWMPIDR